MHFRPDSVGGTLICLIEDSLNRIDLKNLYKHSGDLLYAIKSGYEFKKENILKNKVNNKVLLEMEGKVLSEMQAIRELLPKIEKAAQQYFLGFGEINPSIEELERAGELEINRSFKLKWNFKIESPNKVIANSTVEMPDGIGKWVIYDSESNLFESNWLW